MTAIPPYPFHRAVLAPLAVFVLAAACAGALVWTLESQNRTQKRIQAADTAGDHVQALQRAIGLALSANNALVALVRQGQGTVSQFEEIGAQMLPFYPGIAAMGLSPGGVVRQVVPRQGNENLIGFDQLNDPRQGAESARARESGLLTLAGTHGSGARWRSWTAVCAIDGLSRTPSVRAEGPRAGAGIPGGSAHLGNSGDPTATARHHRCDSGPLVRNRPGRSLLQRAQPARRALARPGRRADRAQRDRGASRAGSLVSDGHAARSTGTGLVYRQADHADAAWPWRHMV